MVCQKYQSHVETGRITAGYVSSHGEEWKREFLFPAKKSGRQNIKNKTKQKTPNFNPGLKKKMIKAASSPEVVTAWF